MPQAEAASNNGMSSIPTSFAATGEHHEDDRPGRRTTRARPRENGTEAANRGEQIAAPADVCHRLGREGMEGERESCSEREQASGTGPAAQAQHQYGGDRMEDDVAQVVRPRPPRRRSDGRATSSRSEAGGMEAIRRRGTAAPCASIKEWSSNTRPNVTVRA
jgi:hypothetical protein